MSTTQHFHELYNKYAVVLIRLVTKRVKNIDVAKDIVQDVFIYAWTHIDNLTNAKNVGGYLYCMAMSRVGNYLEKEQNKLKHEEEYIRRQDHSVCDFNYINKSINQLPPKQRHAMLMKLDGKRYDEIAEAMHISVNTVNHHLTSAYIKLRKILKPI